MNSPFEYFKSALLEKYADFDGRARRSEYWYYTLFLTLGMFVAMFVIGSMARFPILLFSLIGILTIGILVPSLAVSVRRLHDLNKSGWFLLIQLIPFVGGIIFLVWMCTEGTRGRNEFGPDPKSFGENVDDHLV